MEDPRCCGTGTCIINEDGQCWCGQTWDGERMCFAVGGKLTGFRGHGWIVDDPLNMKDARGRAIARQLALEADIIVENYRPGVLEKWQLGYMQLKAINPATIMVNNA